MLTTTVPKAPVPLRSGRHRAARRDEHAHDSFTTSTGRPRGTVHRTRRSALVAAALTAGLIAGPAMTDAAVADSYTVRSGDTLSGIAQRHGTTWRALYQLNRRGVARPSRIFVGQTLELGAHRAGHHAQPTGRSATAASNGSFGKRVLAHARQVKGVPYRYGGASPAQGFDCSGLTSYVFAQAGKTIPRTSAAQAAVAHRISRSQLRQGDLIFYHPSGRVSHVAIYAGNGMVWEAPSSGRQVRYAPIWNVPRFYGRI